MEKYHKINTLFERDYKTKKLIIGQFSDEEVEYLAYNEWEFTEKVDGTNIRVHWDGHKVSFGGRTDNAQIPSHLINRLNDLFGGEVNAQIFEQRFGEKEVTLYGEGYGVKIQNGGSYRDDVDFILFDVMINNTYLPRDRVESIAECFNIDVVPVVLKGTLMDGVNYVLQNPKSIIAKNGAPMEGLVARPKCELYKRNGERIIVKIKCRDFDTNKE